MAAGRANRHFRPWSARRSPQNMSSMWIDERGSEVLVAAECHRLLALGSKEGRHGHVGLPKEGAPLVLPLDYAVQGPDVLVRVGEGIFRYLSGGPLVGFQVDGVQGERLWSVLVRGLAIEEDESTLRTTLREALPAPRVGEPGHRIVRIRSDIVTGRRFVPHA